VAIVEEFVKSRNVAETMKSIKDLNSSQTKVALIVKLLQTIMRENEEDQNLAGDLLKKCFDEKMLTKESLTKGIESYIRKLSKSDKESDIVKAALGKFSARLIVEDVFDLHTVNNAMEAVDLLFLQCLKDLKQLKGEDWLLELFNNSKVNLATTLAEQGKNAEKMTEVLQEQGLIFLSPQLKAQSELFKQIQNDPNVSSLYKWIKDNIDVKLHSSPEFASVLTTCVLKYVTMTTSLAPNVDRNQPLDKEIQDQEKLMMENMKPLLQKFLNDNVQLQVSALYALQVFCHCNEFPKGLLLRMFVTLYDLEIIEEDAFISWKEDVNDQHPGKGRALFQVNSWLTWLETAAEESSESEPE
ncbi:eukaryotic translation initiation factor 4 gamma 2-like, partial [Paramuricea clavata]